MWRFVFFCAFLSFFVLFVLVDSFRKKNKKKNCHDNLNYYTTKKNKKVWNCANNLIYITTEFILLLTWIFFNYHNLFQLSQFFLSQSFSIIAIFFNYHNLFQLSQSFFQSSQYFSIITIVFKYHNLFQLSQSSLLQSFSIITIFFSYHNLFQVSQYFSIITIFFNHHNLFYYNLWCYLYENKPEYKLHHLTHVFYRQSMTKIFLSIS